MNIPIQQYMGLLWAYLKPQKLAVFWLAAALLVGIGLQLLNPQIIRYFIDTAQEKDLQVRGNALILAGLLYLTVALAQSGLNVLTTYLSQSVAWRATNALRTDLTRHVLKLDLSFHNAHAPGELLERIDGDVDRLANFFSQFMLQIISGLLLTLGVLALIAREDWRIALILALFVVAYLVVHTRGQAMAAPHWEKERTYTAEMVGFVEERVAGVRDIQTSGAAAYTVERFYSLLQRWARQALTADVITDLGWAISKSFYEVGTVVAMAGGAYLFINGQMTLGTVYLILHYLALLNGPLNHISAQIEDLQQARVSIQRVSELMDARPKVTDGPGAPSGSTGPLPSTGALALSFDDVSFGYRADTPVLRAINFALPAGASLGLLGRTGSGKSTLSRLLFRLYDVDAGAIRVSNTNIQEPTRAQLRQRIGMVTQNVQLFQASVRDNLTLFDPTITDGAVHASLTQLGLDDWVNALPQGLETVLSADGAGLSAGEGQLLALARVFLQDPGIVILDEASSRLDPATERLLERALDGLLADRTCIIIAHRLSTVRRADQIMILENGAIKEHGAYDTLASDAKSTFAQLLQTGLEEVLA